MTDLHPGRPARRRLALGILLALLATGAGDAAARPDDRWYAFIMDHDPRKFWTIIHTADDLLADGGRFRLFMDGRGVLLAISGSTITQKDYIEIRRRRPGLELVVCKETMQRLLAGLKGRRIPPLLPGVRVEPCHGILSTLDKDGWRRPPGLGF